MMMMMPLLVSGSWAKKGFDAACDPDGYWMPFCFLVALEQTSTTRYSAFNIHCNRVCLRVLAPAITHAELDHCRSLPLWAERGPALLFVHSVHRDEPNDLLDTLPDTLPQGNHYLTGITGLNWAKNRTPRHNLDSMVCPGTLEKARRAGGSRRGERVPPCNKARRRVSGINVPLSPPYVSVHKTKGMPGRLREDFKAVRRRPR
ncbi:hypothetical protein B0T09DRAFT_187285 [Sordaria sp. MPI-SDFR-AT-0083]|nr:hypothetical protein B0T09DRAFT_187285 [Sordaria sp. MPI-SDFR-AT-0083]